eukprot:CAMPEP_0171529418 /NCGR_PEP_ID=MMETSP0959-20130129/12343_1 /TAXON_ID=87120 /ORGANISM="Aurantiochytrium limacinum, Strain ATCCMYA-1381" /LENGTH=256 /DNA_ID=CAMNT_0012071761 /DNA_START=229 /DNA_END=998 /DNA_ORIENTATION=-
MQNSMDLNSQGNNLDVPEPPMAPMSVTGSEGDVGHGMHVGRSDKDKRPRRPHRRRSDPEHHKRMQIAIVKAAGDVTLSALHRCVKEATKNNGQLPVMRNSLSSGGERNKVRSSMGASDRNPMQSAGRDLSSSSITPSSMPRVHLSTFSDNENVTGATLNKLVIDMQNNISKVAAETAAEVAAQVATKSVTKSANNALMHSLNGRIEEIVQQSMIGVFNRLAAIEEQIGLVGDVSKANKRGTHPGAESVHSKKPRHA